MRNQLTCYAIIFVTTTFSQIQKKTIIGKVLFENSVISNAHIINQKTNQGTNTSNFGMFEIPVSIGDTLHFSHINYNSKKIIINGSHIVADTLSLHLTLKVYQLEEITLQKQKNAIDSSSQTPHPKINALTLNLPYAGTKVKKNYSVLRMRSGIVISIDNFINFINGNNRRRKKLKKITHEDDSLYEIRNYFKDDFFISQLHIKLENINLFLNYCFKKNIIQFFNRKDYVTLKIIMAKESIAFLKEINKNDSNKKF